MRAFSIGRTVSNGKTGLGSIEPGTGSFHVLSRLSIARRVAPSTKVYASMNVPYRFRPRYTVYGVPTFLMMLSSTYKEGNFLLGAV